MRTWKDLFMNHILERGRIYYKSGAVTDINKTDTGYSAVVEGTEDYDVEIELDGEKISELCCSCPYAEDGNYCKHMAAVLYYLEGTDKADIITEEPIQENAGNHGIKEILEGISGDEAKKFLLKLANEDIAIESKIIATYSQSITPTDIKKLKRRVDEIFYSYSDRHEFIDWRNASAFSCEIESFLYDEVMALIDNEMNMQAFDLTSYVFIKIVNQDMDDSGGHSSMIAGTCYDMWAKALEQCDEQGRETMFQWFLEHQEGKVIDYMEDYISEFLFNQFNDRELLLKKLEFLDERIAATGEKTDCGESWSARYGHENNILKRLEIMRRLELPENEITEYRKKYRHFSKIRELEIQEFTEKQNYDKAIAVLLESKELDKGYPGLIAKYSVSLIDIYQKLNTAEKYKEELLYYVFSCRQNNLDYIKKLKECCSETEWQNHLERLFSEPNAYGIKFRLLEEEQKYEQLLKDIISGGYVYDMDQYEKLLYKEYPNQVRDFYVDYVTRKADKASNRKAYQELMPYLKKICKYPAGKEAATEIAGVWKTEYRRRPAMMEELRKAGF